MTNIFIWNVVPRPYEDVVLKKNPKKIVQTYCKYDEL